MLEKNGTEKTAALPKGRAVRPEKFFGIRDRTVRPELRVRIPEIGAETVDFDNGFRRKRNDGNRAGRRRRERNRDFAPGRYRRMGKRLSVSTENFNERRSSRANVNSKIRNPRFRYDFEPVRNSGQYRRLPNSPIVIDGPEKIILRKGRKRVLFDSATTYRIGEFGKRTDRDRPGIRVGESVGNGRAERREKRDYEHRKENGVKKNGSALVFHEGDISGFSDFFNRRVRIYFVAYADRIENFPPRKPSREPSAIPRDIPDEGRVGENYLRGKIGQSQKQGRFVFQRKIIALTRQTANGRARRRH